MPLRPSQCLRVLDPAKLKHHNAFNIAHELLKLEQLAAETKAHTRI